ncbi:MAG TPA: caspase family protein [Rhodocyclaceae bacterium]
MTIAHRAVASFLVAISLSITSEVAPAAPRKVALVVGNSAYAEAPLRNPANDARAMARTLRELGFEVIERVDATQKDMNRAVTAFGEKLGADSIALFFYAGHGLQVRGKNFLIPVDARITSEASVRSESVDVDIVLEQIASTGSGLNFVILDACRNNPFERRFRATGGGLAQMDAPKGTFIAYATAPGRTASDGDGDNGLYTQELLKAITAPGLKVEDVFKRVRVEVARASNDNQLPWESSSLTGDFYFKPPQAVATKASGPNADALELELWKSAQQLDAIEAYRAYLDAYPDGRYARLAGIGIKQAERRSRERTKVDAAMQAALAEANARARAAEEAARTAAALARLGAAGGRAAGSSETEAALRAEIEQANARADAAEQAAKAARLGVTEVLASPVAHASPIVDASGSGESVLAQEPGQPREGDEWTYRFIDRWKRQPVADYRIRLESVGADAIKERIDYIDPKAAKPGAEILRARWIDRNSVTSQLDAIPLTAPAHSEFTITEWLPYQPLPASLKKGHVWEGPFTIDGEPCSGSAELGKEESIDVPAGTFKARLIELECQRDAPLVGRSPGDTTRLIRLRIWHANGLYRPLRIEKSIKGNFQEFDRDSIELVRFSRAAFP